MKAKGLLLQLLAANGGRIAAGEIQAALIELRDQGLVKEDFVHKGIPKHTSHHITYDWVLTKPGRAYIKNLEKLQGIRAGMAAVNEVVGTTTKELGDALTQVARLHPSTLGMTVRDIERAALTKDPYAHLNDYEGDE